MNCDSIADISLKKFNSLPKTGKPNSTEWTILSTIVLHDNLTNKLEVLSLGTGSKCIGQSFMSPNGDILNDSHAEIICRRTFLKFLYNELKIFLKNDRSDIFYKDDNNQLTVKPNLTFHMFSTHMPCGDASIFPKNENDDYGNVLKNESDSDTEIESKRIKLDTDIHRTGAKCLIGDEVQDPKKPGEEYHVLGAVRTKPGRGDPTLSVSCSDKMLKWTILGIQGSLLYKILKKPLYITSITIAKNTPFCPIAFKRAIFDRIEQKKFPHFQYILPKIQQSSLDFCFSKDSSKQPCPSSIIWYRNCKKVEVAIEGKKQGVTKKNLNTKMARLSICKRELFQDFCNILKEYDVNVDFCKDYNYFQWKNDENCQYNKTWSKVKTKVFKIWPCKNKNLLLFKAE